MARKRYKPEEIELLSDRVPLVQIPVVRLVNHRSRLAGTSVVAPDFLAAFAGPRIRSSQCRQLNEFRIDDDINRLTDAYTWLSPKVGC
jgi:hypothetical protein